MDSISVVSLCRGHRVTGIERIHYVAKGDVDRRTGPLVLRFDSGTVLRLDVGPDTESLVAFDTPWKDPYEDARDTESIEFVKSHGKWTAFEVGGEAPYARLLGLALLDVHAVRNQFGSVSGAKLEFEAGQTLYFLAAADEAWVMDADVDLAAWDMSLERVSATTGPD